MIRICVLLYGLFFLTSCGGHDEIPEGILKPEKMQAVLWDVLKAEAFTSEFIKKDSAKDAVAENFKLQQEVFAIHKISKTDFYDSYDFYKSNTRMFKVILDSIIAKGSRDRYPTIKPVVAE